MSSAKYHKSHENISSFVTIFTHDKSSVSPTLNELIGLLKTKFQKTKLCYFAFHGNNEVHIYDFNMGAFLQPIPNIKRVKDMDFLSDHELIVSHVGTLVEVYNLKTRAKYSTTVTDEHSGRKIVPMSDSLIMTYTESGIMVWKPITNFEDYSDSNDENPPYERLISISSNYFIACREGSDIIEVWSVSPFLIECEFTFNPFDDLFAWDENRYASVNMKVVTIIDVFEDTIETMESPFEILDLHKINNELALVFHNECLISTWNLKTNIAKPFCVSKLEYAHSYCVRGDWFFHVMENDVFVYNIPTQQLVHHISGTFHTHTLISPYVKK